MGGRTTRETEMQMTRRQWMIWRYIDAQARRQANFGMDRPEEVSIVAECDSDIKMMTSLGVIEQVSQSQTKITVRFTPLGKKPHGVYRKRSVINNPEI